MNTQADTKQKRKGSKKDSKNRKAKKYHFSTRLRMLPPWLYAPDFECGHIAWRMGEEDYMIIFKEWILMMPRQERKWYFQDFPPPQDWTEWVEYICEDDPRPYSLGESYKKCMFEYFCEK